MKIIVKWGAGHAKLEVRANARIVTMATHY